MPFKWRVTPDGDGPPQDQPETEGHGIKVRPVTDDPQDGADAEGHAVKIRPLTDEQTTESEDR